MNPTKLADTILNRIEQEKIQPRSKWYYRFRYGSFWTLFGLMLILGALSFAVIIFAVRNTDFEIFEYVESNGWQQLLGLMPLLWMLLIGLAIGLGIWGLKHTKHGYRLALLVVLAGNVFGSLLLGTLVYSAGGGEVIEEIIETRIPIYESVREKHERFWGRPEDTGRLAGLVQSIDTEAGTMTVSGPRGRQWDIELQDARLPENFVPQIGQPIKMKGQVRATGQFQPARVKPAQRQEKINRKIQERFRQNPALRDRAKERTKPEIRQPIRQGERPEPRLDERLQNLREGTKPLVRPEVDRIAK